MRYAYTTTTIPYSELQSPELRGMANIVTDTLTEAFTIDGSGESYGEAIVYQEQPRDDFYVFEFANAFCVWWVNIETEEGHGPTDDDYDDAIREWIENRDYPTADWNEG